MEQFNFTGKSQEEIIDILEANAETVVRDTTYQVKLTEGQIAQLKNELVDETKALQEKEDEKKAVLAKYREEISEMRERIREIVTSYELGYELARGDLYTVLDYEDNLAHLYDGEGRLITTRTMKASERQLNIMRPNLKPLTGTDND